ncbi:hydroxymethylglutaryl-coenzyme A reductase-domain-containing protein [Boletus edulis BED1]|uniref:3-hydroxy-3-methylglutaryl coenzyme A reductase n=1 Tax=Boletus edulis BED1 TaxID=1328754 RepID=A0AAD4GBZ3_BOLED|nr:hydroxymethylglutaryl-coenzyme A reductase-domain-containing protein [Boletus edulis BED1]
MRVPLLPLTGRAVYSPIETIVAFFVIGTLAYFRILFAIKHSSFFAPVFPSTLSTTHALLRDGQWVVVDEERYLKRTLDPQTQKLEIQQLVFSTTKAVDPVIARSLDWAYLAPSISNLTHHISDVFVTASGQSYSAVCFHPSAGGQCFTEVSNQASGSQTVTLSFVPGAHEEFVDALKAKAFYPADSFGVQYRIQSFSDGTIGGMKSGKWIAYAASALISRFWELAKKADSLDILLVLAGYILMHASFIRLFLASRALGSNFWLTTAIVSSSILSFILALPISHYLEIPLDPISLTEALPFLVCTVGFDKQLRLAKAIFNHPHLTTPVKEGRWRGQMKPAGEVVFEAMGMVGNLILRDYGLEIAALLLGARSKVGGLMEFCALAALSLVLDCIVFGTFYAAVLTIMVEVRRIQTARVLTRSRSANNLTAEGTVSALARPSQSVEGPNLHHKFSDTLLGIKGSMLRDKNSPPTDEKEQDPVARLKLLLLVSFLTLHILNFTTTLAPATIAPFELRSSLRTLGDYQLEPRKVDIASPAIAIVLDTIAAFHTSNNFTTSSVDVLVKVAPPLSISVIPPGPARPRALFRSSEIIDNFMSGWTNLVGDPVISKWIVFVLAASVVLNGYLLKGIAEGAIRGLQPPSVRFRSVGAVKRDRDVDEEIETPQARSTAIRRKPSFVVGPPKPKPGDSGATNTPESVPSPLLESKHLIAPTPIPANKEISGVPAFLLDMKLRVQPTAIVTKEPHLPARSLEECIEIFEHGPRPVQVSLSTLNDEEIIILAQDGKIAPYALEKVLGDLERAVSIRRALISRATPTKTLEHSDIPMANYDYSRVFGACCENVVGYIPIPLGIAGPLTIDGEQVHIPMATAEGTLVASTSRGCKALNSGGGVTTVLTHDAMTRGPAIDFPSVVMAAAAKAWVDSDEGYEIIREAFESTSRFAKLQRLKTAIAGRTLFVRFATKTGDAMGMNMISKGTEKALEVMKQHFPEMVTLALSGNYCTDKKPAAINWIEGRGKGVVAEAIVPGKVVRSVLKTTVEALCNLNIKKNLVGSAMAGAIGGFNAHAANILTAIFLATGQDPAQNVESSNCITLMEPINDGEDLLLTVSMPCIEVGTVGGGTVLAPQGAVLEMLGIKGAHLTTPGMNAQRLARIIAASVMAGELSLLSALAAGHLVRAHLVHNRSQANTPNSSRPVTPSITSRPMPWEQPPSNPPTLSMQVLSHSSSTSSLPPYSESKP